eukprot:2392400-Pyramimonas_sp.AAC.1
MQTYLVTERCPRVEAAPPPPPPPPSLSTLQPALHADALAIDHIFKLPMPLSISLAAYPSYYDQYVDRGSDTSSE